MFTTAATIQHQTIARIDRIDSPPTMIAGFQKWLARARSGNVRMPGLFWFSMAECTIVPIPLEIILFPVMQLNRAHVWRVAFWVTLGALIGALIFYALANMAMAGWGQSLIDFMGWQAQHAQFDVLFARYGFWAILIAGILPIPLQLAMLAAGAASYPLIPYCIAIIASRAMRYYGIGWLVLRYGNRGQQLFERNKWQFSAYALGFVGLAWAVVAVLQKLLLS